MTDKIKNYISLAVILILGIIGIVGYSTGGGGEPLRVLFKTKGGPVIFSHKAHYPDGYGYECEKCHHNRAEDSGLSSEPRCRTCHNADNEDYADICEDDSTHKQCVGKNCVTCHIEEAGMEKNDCGYCHKP